VSAPFGRRACAVVGREVVGGYVVLSVADEAVGASPGQFYMLAAVERWGGGEGERPYLGRALSALGAADGVVRFLLEDVGPGTRRLCELGVGDEVWLVGPLGKGFVAPPAGMELLLVGGGVGIPPLVMAHAAWGGRALVGFRDGKLAVAASLFGDVAVATDDGSVGHHGLVSELLAAELRSGVCVYACGPPGMLEAVRALCVAHGVPGWLALEAPMACGYGACFGCVVATADGYQRVCVDGPVFEAAALA
jgi:dihydroorotate dehydrogenase electron transfer subunit